MSHFSSVFSRVPIEVPNRSGFDMSHENMGTLTTGTLTPVLVDELLPNDTISLGSNFQVQLPPMASDFYGRVDMVLEAFFVPSRLLWGGWQSFMTHPTANPQYPVNTPVQGRSRYMPLLKIPGTISSSNYPPNSGYDFPEKPLGAGSLSDYLGYKARGLSDSEGTTTVNVNLLPYLAYHRIWDDHYRDSRIQAPLFYRPDVSAAGNIDRVISYRPYTSGGINSADITDAANNIEGFFTDRVNITQLRQRNWAKDYFTTASPLPQAGSASTVTFSVQGIANENGAVTASGAFSIATLRAANSMQRWCERNNIMGYQYSDQIYGQYGIYPSDAIMDKCIYLGRHTENVYTRSVFQTSDQATGGITNPNPWNVVGSKFGSSQAIGQGSLVKNIRVTEHGYLFVLASLVPHAYYSTGVRRYLTRKVVGDIAFPLLAGMGDQAIMSSELSRDDTETDDVFGYTDRYAEYKYHDDEVHGLLVDGESLEHFCLQRSFDSNPELGSNFLQIPKDYLNQVFATTLNVSGFSAWYDIYFPYKKVSTLPEYSLPTLADLKHAHTVYASRGGKRL